MGPNSVQPVFVTAVVVILIASVVAAIVLWWDPAPRTRQIVRRAWFVVTVLSALGVMIFWISTAMIGTGYSTVDRSLQQKQQDDLHKRLKTGGH